METPESQEVALQLEFYGFAGARTQRIADAPLTASYTSLQRVIIGNRRAAPPNGEAARERARMQRCKWTNLLTE